MFLKAQPLFMITQTPLHMGTGTDLGIIDLPIQRERSTGFPKLEASGLKGSIREEFEKRADMKVVEDLFGPGPDNMNDDNDRASALGFTDGRLLFFPVKSVKDVYALITCRTVLNRFIEDINMCLDENLHFLPLKDANSVYSKDSKLLVNDNKIILEEYTFSVKVMEDEEKTVIDYIYELLSKYYSDGYFLFPKYKIVILTDEDFRDFVNYSTEVITRTRIGNSGTVEGGALFTEEYVPVNTVFYSIVLASPIFVTKGNKEKSISGNNEIDEVNKIIQYFRDKLPSIIQLGGNATLGKGLVKIAIGGNN